MKKQWIYSNEFKNFIRKNSLEYSWNKESVSSRTIPMLSCMVQPRFGQEDKISSSMPSSPAFSMQCE